MANTIQFEFQSKNKLHDRWGQREGGANGDASGSGEGAQGQGVQVKKEGRVEVKQEERARKIEHRMSRAKSGPASRVKAERFDDDYKREGRQTQRGLEGGEDEELDFDPNEHFQDDDDVNTFHVNDEEEEDARMQNVGKYVYLMTIADCKQEQLRKEQRMANANVGDKPQIEDSEDEDEDLFGDADTKKGNKKLKKMMRKGMENNGTFDSDSVGPLVTSRTMLISYRMRIQIPRP
jgi:transcription initiation factor TFIIF subunit alpha